jgi:hypothetical protein
MEPWEIAKRLLVDERFVYVYSQYQSGMQLAKECRNYHKVDMTTRSRKELHNMLRKLNCVEGCVKWAVSRFGFTFNYQDMVKEQKDRIRQQLNYYTANTDHNDRESRKSKRRKNAKISKSFKRNKNR